ncbi:MAG: type II toxin-antitoxin system VapC family toxin [Sphingomonadaceae bacterium]
MRLLLDAHFILWLTTDRAKLSQSERAVLDEENTELIVPAAGLWELTIKWNVLGRKGERRLNARPEDVYAAVTMAGWDIASLDGRTATTELQIPIAHKDPFDRLLLVQAQQLGIQLLTRDQKLIGHPLVFSLDAP